MSNILRKDILLKKGYTDNQADAILSGNTLDLAREIAYSTGRVDKFVEYFNLKELIKSIESVELEVSHKDDTHIGTNV